MKSIVLLLLMCIGLVTPLLIAQVPTTNNSPFLIYAQPLETLAPGESGVPVNFTVVYIKPYVMYNVIIKPDFVFPFTSYYYKGGVPNFTFAQIQPGFKFSFILFTGVNPKAHDGVYNMYFIAYNSSYYYYDILYPVYNVSSQVPILGYVNFTGDTVWGSETDPLTVSAGDQRVPLSIYVSNGGDVIATNVTVEVNSTYPVQFLSDKQYVGNVPIGTPVPVVFTANVYPNATPGVYNIPVTITYFNGSVTKLKLPVTISGYVNFTATSVWGTEQQPIQVTAGESRVPLSIILVNGGLSTVTNVTVEVNSTYPVQFLSDKQYVGNVPIGTPVPVVFTANVYPNATPGVYNIPVTITYFNGISQKIIVSVVITGVVNFTGTTVWGSENQPLIVSPGETDVPLSIVLVNSGTVSITNASVYIGNSYPIIPLQDHQFIGDMPIGAPITVTIMANIVDNASIGIYYIPVTVTYYGGMKETVLLPVSITGYVKYSLTSLWGTESSPISASPGETQLPLTVILQNGGTVVATNVSVSVSSEYPIMVTTNTKYVGNVPIGTPVPVVFTANVYPNATPGVYNIPVTITYFNGMSQIYFIPVIISGPNITVNYALTPPQIFQGYTDVQVQIILGNTGAGIGEGLNVSLSSPFPLISSSIVHLGAIPTGTVEKSIFLINVPSMIEPGLYQMDAIIKFDGGVLDYKIPITIYPKANFSVIGVYYSTLTPGASKVAVTIELRNNANVTAKNLVAIFSGGDNAICLYVSSTNPLQSLTASKSFVGDVRPGEVFNVTYIVSVSSGVLAPANYTLPLTLEWNQTGSLYPFIQNVQFTLTVSPSLSQTLLKDLTTINKTSIILYISIIIIILVVVLIAVIRKRK